MSYLFYNIKKHNYIRFSSKFPETREWSFCEICVFLWLNFKFLIVSIVKYRGRLRNSFIAKPLSKVVVLSLTENQKKTTDPICRHLDAEQVSVISDNINEYVSRECVNIYSALYIINFAMTYLFSAKKQKKIIRQNVKEFYNTIGTIRVAEFLLRQNYVKLLVVANDHSMFYRAFIIAAKKYGIDTMYLQHASVTYRFPPLQFSYAFLDGEDALQKYRSAGNIEGDVYLCGSPRFDILKKYRSRVEGVILGVTINLFDNESKIRDMLLFLKERGYTNIIVRPHPRKNIDFDWYLNRKFCISNSKSELSFEFLSKISLLISGESGIHLDSALVGVKSICYNFSDYKDIEDWYSYHKNGLYPMVNDFESLLCEIQKNSVEEISKEKIVYYNAAYGLPIEGHVGEMLADFIQMFICGNLSDFDKKYCFEKGIDEIKRYR